MDDDDAPRLSSPYTRSVAVIANAVVEVTSVLSVTYLMKLLILHNDPPLVVTLSVLTVISGIAGYRAKELSAAVRSRL